MVLTLNMKQTIVWCYCQFQLTCRQKDTYFKQLFSYKNDDDLKTPLLVSTIFLFLIMLILLIYLDT